MQHRRFPIKTVLTAIVVAVGVGAFVARGLLRRPDASDAGASAGPPERIVSLSPSITEILFALKQGDRVVGVTRYCSYPPEVAEKAKVGGFQDPNFEAIVALEPDLVILRESNEQAAASLRELGIPTLAVCHKNLDGILESILSIGQRCGAEQEAQRVVADLRAEMRLLEEKTAGLSRPRVLFTVERTLKTGKIQDVYVAGRQGTGREGFIDQIIAMAGGQNACPENVQGYCVVSAEGILTMNPEVILDMVPAIMDGGSGGQVDRKAALADWQQLPQIEAVRTGRVYLLDDDYAFIPGPRLVLLAGKVARLIHPEVDWQR